MNDKSEISGSQMADVKALMVLASKRFGKLTSAEIVPFSRTAVGEEADYRSPNQGENDPAGAQDWKVNRVLNAESIAWLCADKRAREFVTHRGLRIRGARIEGVLDFEALCFPFSCVLRDCAITDGATFRYSQFLNLILSGSLTGSIVADGIKTGGDVYLNNGFRAEGEVRFLESTIGGRLQCDGGTFNNPNGRALCMDGMKVEGSVFLNNNFRAEGEVRLLRMAIGGNLVCEKGTFINSNGPALIADGARVEGSVFLSDGFKPGFPI